MIRDEDMIVRMSLPWANGPAPMWSYFKAGSTLHMMTILEMILFGFVLQLHVFKGVSAFEIGFQLFILSFFGSLPVFSQLDARSRYQNYKKVKDQIRFHGFDLRLLKPLRKSRCLRDAALAAADELGFGGQCRDYFRTSGYRWWHLAPDFVFTTPQFLLSRYFWESTFFLKKYQPRASFKECECSSRA